MYLIKVVLVGDTESRRLEFGNRLSTNPGANFISTIGARFHVWRHTTDRRQFKFQVWEVAQTSHHSDYMFRGSFCGIIFLNASSQSSILSAIAYLTRIWRNSGRGAIPILLCDTRVNEDPEHPDMELLTALVEELCLRSKNTGVFCKLIRVAINSIESAKIIQSILPTLIMPWIEHLRRNRAIYQELEQFLNDLLHNYFPELDLDRIILPQEIIPRYRGRGEGEVRPRLLFDLISQMFPEINIKLELDNYFFETKHGDIRINLDNAKVFIKPFDCPECAWRCKSDYKNICIVIASPSWANYIPNLTERELFIVSIIYSLTIGPLDPSIASKIHNAIKCTKFRPKIQETPIYEGIDSFSQEFLIEVEKKYRAGKISSSTYNFLRKKYQQRNLFRSP